MLDDAFWPALWNLAVSVGTRPETLLAVWDYESGLDPSAVNPSSNCIGLNQTCPKPNGPGFPNDDPAAYAAATASAQLAWIAPQVVSAYHLNGGPFLSVARYYQSNYLPTTLTTARGPRDVIAAAAGPYAREYNANRILDAGADGAITLEDLGRVLEQKAKTSTALRAAIAKAYEEKPTYAPAHWTGPALIFYEPSHGSTDRAGGGFLAALFVTLGLAWMRRHA